MKIALINPSHRGFVHYSNPETWVKNLGVYPPLGLLYVASWLRERTPNKVEVIDLQLAPDPEKVVRDQVCRGGYGIVGISCLPLRF